MLLKYLKKKRKTTSIWKKKVGKKTDVSIKMTLTINLNTMKEKKTDYNQDENKI